MWRSIVFPVVAFVLGLSLGACARGDRPPESAGKTGSDSLHVQVLGELQDYYDDFSARDWNAYADHFWPAATLTTVWQPVGLPAPTVVTITLPEFVARAPEGPGSKPIFEERLISADVQAEGDLAQAWARYSARFGDSTEVVEWRGVDAFTLMRHGGRWRIISLAYTSAEKPRR
jgi:hypothetical protein